VSSLGAFAFPFSVGVCGSISAVSGLSFLLHRSMHWDKKKSGIRGTLADISIYARVLSPRYQQLHEKYFQARCLGFFFFLHGRMYSVIRLDLHSTKKFLFIDLRYRVSTQISLGVGTYTIEPFRSKLEEKKT
jgi:hypothetical protein